MVFACNSPPSEETEVVIESDIESIRVEPAQVEIETNGVEPTWTRIK